MKNLITVCLILLLFLPCLGIAQNKTHQKKAPVLTENQSISRTYHYTSDNPLQVGAYKLIDTMPNAFSAAFGSLNPLAFDHWSHSLGIVHRGNVPYSTNSGQLWYNVSSDYGISWQRVSSPINTVSLKARYPSMAISNPFREFSDSTRAVFSWPEVEAGIYDHIGYGKDEPFGSGNTFSNAIGSGFFTGVAPCWASDSTKYVFWAADDYETGKLTLFRTSDYNNVEIINPVQWNDTALQDEGSIILGGMSSHGVQYFAILGTFADPDPGNPIISGWYPAYSKSTDDGLTWSVWNVIDFRVIPGLTNYDRLWDWIKNDDYVSYQGDMIVDKNGYVHIILGVTDTTTGINNGNNAIVEIYETESGWKGLTISEMPSNSDQTDYSYGSLNQNGYSAFLSKTADHNILAAQWAGCTPADNTVDIFCAARDIDVPEWNYKVNLTNTMGRSESISHLAPISGGSENGLVLLYSMYCYDASDAVPPDEYAPTNIYLNVVELWLGDYGGWMKIASPDGGEKVRAGSVYKIRWYNSLMEGVDISYLKDNQWISIAENILVPKEYNWLVPNTPSDHCKIMVKDHYGIVSDESNSYFSILPPLGVEEEKAAITKFELLQNYPNPFNPSTTIRYSLAEASVVKLKIFDILGREVSTLVNKEEDAGSYEVQFDGSDLSTGIYFCRLDAGSFSFTNKLILMK